MPREGRIEMRWMATALGMLVLSVTTASAATEIEDLSRKVERYAPRSVVDPRVGMLCACQNGTALDGAIGRLVQTRTSGTFSQHLSVHGSVPIFDSGGTSGSCRGCHGFEIVAR